MHIQILLLRIVLFTVRELKNFINNVRVRQQCLCLSERHVYEGDIVDGEEDIPDVYAAMLIKRQIK